MRRRAFVIALLCAACSTVQPISNLSKPAPLLDIPIELRQRLPNVDVLISGQRFKLFLDLGGFHAISLTTAELGRVEVRFLDSPHEFMNSAGRMFESRRFTAASVAIGGLSFGELEGGEFVFDDALAPPDRNGYIGMGLLGQFLVVLDYPARHVRLYRSGDDRAIEAECGRNTFEVSLVDTVAQSVVRTEYGDLRVEWDTGATHNFIRPAAIRRGRDADGRTEPAQPTVTIASARLAGQEVGPLEFRVAQFHAPALDAILGTSFFLSRKVCLDLPQGKGALP
jgi:hypothetical protein